MFYTYQVSAVDWKLIDHVDGQKNMVQSTWFTLVWNTCHMGMFLYWSCQAAAFLWRMPSKYGIIIELKHVKYWINSCAAEQQMVN